MRLTLASMLSLTLPTALLVGAGGVYPTWRLAGWPGLGAELAAGVIVLAVLIASDWAVIRFGRKEIARAYYLFVMFKALRPLVCVAVAAGAWLTLGLAPKVLAAWVLLFYFATFMVEMVWMLKVRRASELADGGKILVQPGGTTVGDATGGAGATC